MTRSVEIPEATVEAAALAMFAEEHCDKRQMLDVRGNWDARLNDEDQALYRSMARAALKAAALPYLAPAGDGGLRYALEALCEYAESSTKDTRPRDKHGPIGRKSVPRLTVDEIRKLLALHPAAPAVPQPAEVMAEDVETTGFYYCPTAGEIEALQGGGFDVCCDKPRLHMPVSRGAWDAIRAMAADQTQAVKQPADERPLRAALERYFSNGGPDTPIRTTWHEGVEHWEAPAEDIRELIEGSAVPQPVDREALAQWLYERFGVHMEPLDPTETASSWGALSADNRTWWVHEASAVLAVLAGEQEQVDHG